VVIGVRNLARCVARQREPEFGDGYSAAVIPDSRETHAARFDFDFDTLRARIEAVLDQLLDDGRGAFDDLTGGDLVDEVIVENADRHGREV
jgi:hypothetical protein